MIGACSRTCAWFETSRVSGHMVWHTFIARWRFRHAHAVIETYLRQQLRASLKRLCSHCFLNSRKGSLHHDFRVATILRNVSFQIMLKTEGSVRKAIRKDIYPWPRNRFYSVRFDLTKYALQGEERSEVFPSCPSTRPSDTRARAIIGGNFLNTHVLYIVYDFQNQSIPYICLGQTFNKPQIIRRAPCTISQQMLGLTFTEGSTSLA